MKTPPKTPILALDPEPPGAHRARPPRTTVTDFLRLVRWLDGSPILDHIEPYRLTILRDVLESWDDHGDQIRYSLALLGRGKKNFKSCDLMLACLFALCANDSVRGSDVLVAASDEGQAADDYSLLKKLIHASPPLARHLKIYEKEIARKDGNGTLKILPNDIAGAHGKTARLVAIDEVHTQRSWELIEALALDPHRHDGQMLLTSYASIHHKPGAPLHDLLALAKKGTDPKFYCSWFAADWCSDPAAMALPTPEARANPSLATFTPGYLDTQRTRLPAHVFRRLHLNLPGLPVGSAFSVEAVTEAITRGVRVRAPEYATRYHAFVARQSEH